MDFRELQSQVGRWSQQNFPDGKPYQPLLGATEELGELAHAHLKAEQGIRGGEDHAAAKVDAVADVVICARNGIDMDNAVTSTWEKVRRRDWRRDPDNAHREQERDDG